MESNIKGLVAAGHEMASELKAECGAVDMRNIETESFSILSAMVMNFSKHRVAM